MTSVWDRRKPRITYQVPVGVQELAQQRLLTVSSINVSAGGIFVDTTESLAIGTELVCNLPVGTGNEALQVRGRVAWLRDNPSDSQRPVGMGIEFADLSVEETSQLSEIVGDKQETSYPVRMKLSGMGTSVRACAKLTDQGIFIRTPLPFLRQDSQVDFSFVDDEDQSHRGRIVAVEVQHDDDSNVPRLQVEIELDSIGHDELAVPEPSDDNEQATQEPTLLETLDLSSALAPQFIEAEDTLRTESVFQPDLDAYPESESELVTEPDTLPAPLAMPESGDTSDKYNDDGWSSSAKDFAQGDDSGALWSEYGGSHSRSEGRPLWPMAAAVCFVVVGALAFGLYRGDDDAKAAKTSTAGQRKQVLALIEGADFEPVQAIGNEVESEGRAAETPVPDSQPEEPEADSDVAPADSSPAKAKEKIEPPAKPSNHSTETIHGLKIIQGEGLVFRLRLQGNDEGFESYALANPAGIAVNLPHAQPRAGYTDSISPKHPHVRRAWIRDRLGGLHFRLFFTDASQTCKAKVERKALVVRCSDS